MKLNLNLIIEMNKKIKTNGKNLEHTFLIVSIIQLYKNIKICNKIHT